VRIGRRRRREAEIVAIDGSGAVVLRRRADAAGKLRRDFEAIRSLVADAETQVGRSTVGIGMPGAISPATGLVKNANSTWLIGRPFGVDLSTVLARGAAGQRRELPRAVGGHGRRRSRAFTGLRSHSRHRRRRWPRHRRPDRRGRQRRGREWGHNPMPWPTPASGRAGLLLRQDGLYRRCCRGRGSNVTTRRRQAVG
jgi:fructokinase